MTSLLTAVFGCVGMASLVWTVLSDHQLSNVFWPDEFQARVVRWFGGVTTISAGGRQQTELGWFSVLLRTTAFLVIVSMASATVAFVRKRTDAQGKRSDSFGWTVLDRVETIAFPWLFALIWLTVWFLAPLICQQAGLTFLVTTAPLWTAVILAGSLSSLVGSFGRSDFRVGNSNPQTSWWPDFAVVVFAAAVWEIVSFWMNERLYVGLLVPHGDSAMYEEHLWNVWHGKGFRSYLDQGLFLGEHIQVIHLLLLPLHVLWPSYLTMELFASMALAVCVIPIFSMTRRHSGSPRAAMWLSIAWLLFFPMHYLDIAIDFKTLRPSCYGMPFLFWGIDFAERRKLVRSSVCLLIALSTQEDFALITGSIGFVLFLTSREKTVGPQQRRFAIWSLAVLVFSVVYLLLAVLVIIPAFRGGDVVHYSRYFGDLGSSPGELFRTVIRNPAAVLAVVASFRTLFYVLVLTVPLGLWPLCRPKYLLAGAATFLMLSLIQLGNTGADGAVSTSGQAVTELPPVVPYHHFHAPLLPVLFWAAAAGMNVSAQSPSTRGRAGFFAAIRRNWQSRFGSPEKRAAFACFCALCTAVTGSMMPIGVSFWSRESLYVPGPRAVEFPKVLSQLPRASRVASTDYVHTRLTHFDRSYDYSDYLRAVNNYRPGVPADTDYIVIDTSHPYSQIRKLSDVRELRTEPDKWEVLPDVTNGLFIILKRRKGDDAQQHERTSPR